MKFGRNYEIRILNPNNNQLITIAPPISAVIDIDRAVMAQQNNCNVTIYNLNESSRNIIFKDKFNTLQYWQMIILGGYGENELYELFRGNIFEAYSYKENTEWITQVEGTDGSYAIQNSFVAETIDKGQDKKDTIKRMVHALPSLVEGVLGSPAEGTTKRGQVLVGNPYDKIQELTNGNAYIDGETLNVLALNEAIEGEAYELNSDNLFTTPKRREEYIECETLFSPEVRIGYQAVINSKESRYNGTYKVMGIKHHLEVSSASCGTSSSVISMISPKGYLDIVSKQAEAE